MALPRQGSRRPASSAPCLGGRRQGEDPEDCKVVRRCHPFETRQCGDGAVVAVSPAIAGIGDHPVGLAPICREESGAGFPSELLHTQIVIPPWETGLASLKNGVTARNVITSGEGRLSAFTPMRLRLEAQSRAFSQHSMLSRRLRASVDSLLSARA